MSDDLETNALEPSPLDLDSLPGYELPEPSAFPVDIYAQDRVTLSTQFSRDVIKRYIDNYENFWAIGRSEVGKEQMQAILDRLGLTAIAILTDAWQYVQGIVGAFPDHLPAKYHEAPYDYEVVANRIVLGELKEVWQPVAEESEEPADE